MLAVSTVTVGCSSHREPPLEGTTWQLVSIQSMDDAQGTTPVPDPSKFMVTFDKSGQAFFQLDCNRGKGSYTTSTSGDGSEGKLEFGPIAATRMMCAPTCSRTSSCTCRRWPTAESSAGSGPDRPADPQPSADTRTALIVCIRFSA